MMSSGWRPASAFVEDLAPGEDLREPIEQ